MMQDLPMKEYMLERMGIQRQRDSIEEVSQVPKQALSMGIASIMAAKRIVLMAFGQDKADALAAMVKGPITEDLPASILQKHEDLVIIADRAAASKL